MTMTLYFAPGSCARVPMIALEEIGQPFETHLVAFMKGEHRSPEYLAINPAGKVPALIADGRALTQNSAILLYLAQRYPEAALLPLTGDMFADAALLARLVWFSADLHPLVTRIRMPHFFCDTPDGPERARAMGGEGMARQLAPVERALGQQPWLLGADWSILDAYLFWVWFRITGAGFDAASYPAIADHAARIEQRPSVVRALARERAAEAKLAEAGAAVPLR